MNEKSITAKTFLITGVSSGLGRASRWNASVLALVNSVEQDAGPIDVLISNAVFGVQRTVEEPSLGILHRQFDTNVFGHVVVIKAVVPYMRRGVPRDQDRSLSVLPPADQPGHRR